MKFIFDGYCTMASSAHMCFCSNLWHHVMQGLCGPIFAPSGSWRGHNLFFFHFLCFSLNWIFWTIHCFLPLKSRRLRRARLHSRRHGASGSTSLTVSCTWERRPGQPATVAINMPQLAFMRWVNKWWADSPWREVEIWLVASSEGAGRSSCQRANPTTFSLNPAKTRAGLEMIADLSRRL